jgi:hypothetical protein
MARKLRLDFPGAFYHVINAPQAHKPWQLPNVDFRGRGHAVGVRIRSFRGVQAHRLAAPRLNEHRQLGTPVAVSPYVSAFRHHLSSDQSFIEPLNEELKA